MEELKLVFQNQIEALGSLLEALNEQHEALIKKDPIQIEGCLKSVNESAKMVATYEMKRRELTGDDSIRFIVSNSEDEELEDLYRNIVKLINLVKLQKDTNELIIKQGLSYTSKILNILNPDRTIKTYNKSGRIKK